MVCLAKILGSPLHCIGQVTMAGYPTNTLNKSCAMIHHAMITSIVVHISSATGTLGIDWLAWNTNYSLFKTSYLLIIIRSAFREHGIQKQLKSYKSWTVGTSSQKPRVTTILHLNGYLLWTCLDPTVWSVKIIANVSLWVWCSGSLFYLQYR